MNAASPAVATDTSRDLSPVTRHVLLMKLPARRHPTLVPNPYRCQIPVSPINRRSQTADRSDYTVTPN